MMCVLQLRQMGHDVLDIRSTDQKGMADNLLWDKTCREGRLLITTDRDFANYRQAEHHGILIVSLRQPNRQKINKRITEAMTMFPPGQWPGLLVVMRDASMSSWRKGKAK